MTDNEIRLGLPSAQLATVAVASVYLLGFAIAGRHYSALATFDGAPIRLRYLTAALVFLLTIAIPVATALGVFGIAQESKFRRIRTDPKNRAELRPGFYTFRLTAGDFLATLREGQTYSAIGIGLTAYFSFLGFVSIVPTLYATDPALLPYTLRSMGSLHFLTFIWVLACALYVINSISRPKIAYGDAPAGSPDTQTVWRIEPETKRVIALQEAFGLALTVGVVALLATAFVFGTGVYPFVTQTLGGGSGHVVVLVEEDASGDRTETISVLADRTSDYIAAVTCAAGESPPWVIRNILAEDVVGMTLIRPIPLNARALEAFCSPTDD